MVSVDFPPPPIRIPVASQMYQRAYYQERAQLMAVISSTKVAWGHFAHYYIAISIKDTTFPTRTIYVINPPRTSSHLFLFVQGCKLSP